MSSIDDEKAALFRLLDEMRERHARELKPIIDRLVSLEAMRPPPAIFVTAEELQVLRRSIPKIKGLL